MLSLVGYEGVGSGWGEVAVEVEVWGAGDDGTEACAIYGLVRLN